MSNIGLTVLMRLKSCWDIKKGVWRSWVRVFRIDTQENLFFPIAMEILTF